MNNQLVNVQGYVTDIISPILNNKCVITRSMDTKFKDWDKAETFGTQGAVFNVKKPTRFSVSNGLTFNTSTAGQFQQQWMSVATNYQKSIPYQATDFQDAVYTKDSVHGGMRTSQITALAAQIETDSAATACFAGYRFFGSPIVQAGQLSDITQINQAIAVFRSFGGEGPAHYFMPLNTAAQVKTSSYQLFTLKQNDEFTDYGEIGYLGGIPDLRFMESAYLPVHTAGTITTTDAGINQTTGFTISTITATPPDVPGTGTANGTTQITLTGVTNGVTIVPNDLVQIKPPAGNPITFLNYTAYNVNSLNPVQGRVITGGTAAGGSLTFTIEPAWIYDATGTNVNRNLSRAIIPGTDTLQVAETHRCGTLFFQEYIKYVSPKLGPLPPFESASVMGDDGISVRAYFGAVFGGATNFYVTDVIYGYGWAPEGVCRLVLPV